MDALTHLEIARTINDRLKKDFSVKLHRFGFFYGVIKPDFSLRLKDIRHYKSYSFAFVEQEIKRLSGMKSDGCSPYSREFSETLGVIVHFITFVSRIRISIGEGCFYTYGMKSGCPFSARLMPVFSKDKTVPKELKG
jgi:hypothetical protein